MGVDGLEDVGVDGADDVLTESDGAELDENDLSLEDVGVVAGVDADLGFFNLRRSL